MMRADTQTDVAFASCEIVPEARAAAMAVLESGWVTTGSRTPIFERAFAAWVGADDAVAVSSCTAAIELSLRAMNLPPGSPVLTPTLTFCGAVHAIVHAGLRPVLVDVDEQTLVPGTEHVAAAAARTRPRAMVVQHMAGYPVPVRELAAAARLRLTHVVEDAAHGLGASIGAESVGVVSRATCFSFYATKNLPIGEGGAITTSDPEFADHLRRSRLHGMSRDAWRRYHGGSWRYSVDVDGMKANFTDLQAAIGLAQLEQLSAWQHRRAELADRYDAQLRDVSGLELPARPTSGGHAWHLYVVRVGPGYALTRDELAAALAERGVGTSVHFIPIHHLSYFRDLLGAPELPASDRVFPRLLSLPLHPQLTDAEVDRVCGLIAELG